MLLIGISCLFIGSIIASFYATFEMRYSGRIYPNISVGGISFGGKTKQDVVEYWSMRNEPLQNAQFELKFQSLTATVSGTDIELGYDADLSGQQAYLVGRSENILSDLYIKFFKKNVNLNPYLRWKENILDDIILNISNQIDIPAQDSLFTFTNGRVSTFRPSKQGRMLNVNETQNLLTRAFQEVIATHEQHIVIFLPVETVNPLITTDGTNTLGIKELIGRGFSVFTGSIPGRIHNVALAASRINGILVKPGETFSFNEAVGDISAATGYQSAYIIKEGRTVLGDGGGVCQVSSTLFRAILNAGLPVVERHAHAYRVHYYEDGGFKAGLDATVFSPSVDLKFTNNTPSHILIQTKTDINNLTLTFELYGTKDGRVATITNHNVWGISPPPPDEYQDDPTLPVGVVKQVDWAAWGAKASFDYTVVRGTEILEKTTFFSAFRPWRAVYLRGTKQ